MRQAWRAFFWFGRGGIGVRFDLAIGIGGRGIGLDGLLSRVDGGGLSFGSDGRGGGLEGQAFHAFGASSGGGLNAFEAGS
jgi:hypothetical protein